MTNPNTKGGRGAVLTPHVDNMQTLNTQIPGWGGWGGGEDILMPCVN